MRQRLEEGRREVLELGGDDIAGFGERRVQRSVVIGPDELAVRYLRGGAADFLIGSHHAAKAIRSGIEGEHPSELTSTQYPDRGPVRRITDHRPVQRLGEDSRQLIL